MSVWALFIALVSSSALADAALPKAECPLHIVVAAAKDVEAQFRDGAQIIPYTVIPVTPASLLAAHWTGYLPDRGGIWFLPMERGIVPLKGQKLSANLRANLRDLFIKHPNMRVTFNHSPSRVLDECASMIRESDVWLVPEVVHGYEQLARLGIVFSAELWDGDHLVAGNIGLVSGAHVQGATKFRDMKHPLSDGGGRLLDEAERVYLAGRGIETLDVEVPNVVGKPMKPGVQSQPIIYFLQWRDTQTTPLLPVFEGSKPGEALPAVDYDFRAIFHQMRKTQNYDYPWPK
ncbi:hypothetical protein K2X33_15415 [bacterium]|nr:hypothetical protein [bacterium]